MKEIESFRRSISIDLSVATIGIGREDWYCYKPQMKQSEVKMEMKMKNYDVVPIMDKNDRITSYFTMNQDGNLKSYTIIEADLLYYLTHPLDAIYLMKRENKKHYFLANQRNPNDIVGLLSLSNFNCREFYVYMFSLISFVEKELSSLININRERAFDILDKRSTNEELKQQLRVIKDRFKADAKNENENEFKEYLYLHHLVWLVDEQGIYKDFGYKNSQEFISGTGSVKKIRNCIAHPVKSLVSNITDLNILECGINKLYDLHERLKGMKKSNYKSTESLKLSTAVGRKI